MADGLEAALGEGGKVTGRAVGQAIDHVVRANAVIVFVGTVQDSEVVAETLRELGWMTVALHSVMAQHQRLAALQKFKSGVVKVLVATDVASRGLDIPAVDLVVNYDVPRNPDDYIHRVGRTARAGRGGRAVTLVTERDVRLLQAIERTTRRRLTLEKRVTEESVLLHLTRVSTAQRVSKLRLSEKGFEAALEEYSRRREEGKGKVAKFFGVAPPPTKAQAIAAAGAKRRRDDTKGTKRKRPKK